MVVKLCEATATGGGKMEVLLLEGSGKTSL